MPSALPSPTSNVTKFTNCRLLKGESLITQDLWVSSSTGKIIQSQEAFYGQFCVPDETIDLGGRIISPGFIDAQLNGAFGFDFASIPENDGPNSYEVYHHALPFLGPSGANRLASDGTESLGAHVEGPFLAPTRMESILFRFYSPPKSNDLTSLSDCYGASNLLGNIRLYNRRP
ncbi:hypothetical protein DID88_004197 [Monilinia fructigena]|uniref:N-acetylglucosamine-6-phosphate deacetylase n=1 Tax=Monilinia fructigena TaxID=38457 RepID=A0A395ITD1_9HELO|nr:hypothetical protein DID88_004197 [Monilinia fructigena]